MTKMMCSLSLEKSFSFKALWQAHGFFLLLVQLKKTLMCYYIVIHFTFFELWLRGVLYVICLRVFEFYLSTLHIAHSFDYTPHFWAESVKRLLNYLNQWPFKLHQIRLQRLQHEGASLSFQLEDIKSDSKQHRAIFGISCQFIFQPGYLHILSWLLNILGDIHADPPCWAGHCTRAIKVGLRGGERSLSGHRTDPSSHRGQIVKLLSSLLKFLLLAAFQHSCLSSVSTHTMFFLTFSVYCSYTEAPAMRD